MKLINARPSPFGRKVSIALREKGVAFETQWEEPWGPDTEVGRYNPLSQLPIVIADDGEVAFESSFLMEWVERRFPTPPLLPADDDGILAAKQLMALAEGVMDAAAFVVLELKRPPVNAAWVARQRDKVIGGVDALAGRIGGRAFAVRDAFSQADIAIAVNLSMLDYMRDELGHEVEPTRWRDRRPGLARYVDRLEARASFQATRPERIVGLVF